MMFMVIMMHAVDDADYDAYDDDVYDDGCDPCGDDDDDDGEGGDDDDYYGD